MSKLPFLQSLNILNPAFKKKSVISENLPDIEVNVDKLCNIVGRIWTNSFADIDFYELDPIKHDAFIKDTGRCWSYQNQNQEIIEELNYRFSSKTELPHCVQPTLSSIAKSRTEDAIEQKSNSNQIPKARKHKRKTKKQAVFNTTESLLSILGKSPIDRSKEDVKLGFKILKLFSAFSHLSDFVLNQIINVATFVKYDETSIVFRQGQEGTAWYVILEGGVNIFVSPPEFLLTSKFSDVDDKLNLELILKHSKKVSSLEKGFGFGELAMINDAKRAASVLTVSGTILLKLEKRDYIAILKSIHDQEIRSKTQFLKKIPIISKSTTLTSLASAMELKTVPPNTVILSQGTPVQHIYIIKHGKCIVTKTWNETQTIELKIGTLQELDYFGEDYLLYLMRTDTSKFYPEWPSKFSVKSLDHPVTFGVVSIHDALKTFPSTTSLSQVSRISTSPLELKKLALKTLERKSFIRQRCKILDALYREMYKDPRVNRKNLNLFHKQSK